MQQDENTSEDENDMNDQPNSDTDTEGTGADKTQDLLEDESPDASSLAELKAQLEEANEAAGEAQDAILRAQAEAQNTLRRAERDIEHAHKFGQEKLINELLPVADNLERAIEAGGGDDAAGKALLEGVELTMSMFVKALSQFKVEQVDPLGEPFDPQLHQAMSIVENDEVEPNSVVTVMAKGYTLNGRLVRPAMVMVSKTSGQQAPKIDEQA